jgi:hypothetical protein
LGGCGVVSIRFSRVALWNETLRARELGLTDLSTATDGFDLGVPWTFYDVLVEETSWPFNDHN